MATTTITDLPRSRALDYKALSAIRGSGAGDWALSLFVPWSPAIAPVPPVFNFYQTNYIADNLTLQTENINVNNSARGASITVGAAQNALTMNVVPVLPHS